MGAEWPGNRGYVIRCVKGEALRQTRRMAETHEMTGEHAFVDQDFNHYCEQVIQEADEKTVENCLRVMDGALQYGQFRLDQLRSVRQRLKAKHDTKKQLGKGATLSGQKSAPQQWRLRDPAEAFSSDQVRNTRENWNRAVKPENGLRGMSSQPTVV